MNNNINTVVDDPRRTVVPRRTVEDKILLKYMIRVAKKRRMLYKASLLY